MAKRKRAGIDRPFTYTEWRKLPSVQKMLRAHTAEYRHTKYEAYKAKKIIGEEIKKASKQGKEIPSSIRGYYQRLRKAENVSKPSEQYRAEKANLKWLKQNRLYKQLEGGLSKEEEADWLDYDRYRDLLSELEQLQVRSPAYEIEKFKKAVPNEIGAYNDGGNIEILAAEIADYNDSLNRKLDESAKYFSDDMWF